MDAAIGKGELRGESPTIPDQVFNDEADIPIEDAVCSHVIDSSLSSESDTCSMDATPNLSEAIRKELSRGEVDSPKMITQNMFEEEERLQAEGIKKEEERQKENERLLEEANESTEMKYERLKYLLSKSTLYTEYLVDRMKKQKEEQEKKRERRMKRKAKTEEEKGNSESSSSMMTTRGIPSGKRKPEESNAPKTSKRARKEDRVPSQESSAASAGVSGVEGDKDEESSQEREADQVEEKGPETVTFDVDENGNALRYINGEKVPALQPEWMEGGVLRPYQVEGYSWLKLLYENGVNGILADEMGLGKTVQCVAMLAHLVQMGVPGPFLVCAPLSTIPNWLAEFQRFAPKVPTVLYHGHKDQRTALCNKIRRRHKLPGDKYVKPVVITSYEIAMIDRRQLAHNDWKYLIVDEGHRIKNTHCRLIRELRMYNSTHRLLLTGTPLQNNLAELWSLLNFLLPEIFDDKASFEVWFDANGINDASSEEHIVKQERGKNILSMLHQILSPFMLRRLKSDVDLNIPPKKEVLVYAPLTQGQKEFYSALVDRTIFQFIEEKQEKPEEKVELTAAGYPKRRSASRIVNYSSMIENDKDRHNYEKKSVPGKMRWKDLEEEEKELESWILGVNDMKASRRSVADDRPKTSQVTIKMRNVMMQLRKCCNHPYLLEHPLDPKTGDLALTEDVIKESGKMLVLDQMLKELKKRGHRVLIFSQMTRMLDLIEDFCEIRHYNFCRLDGNTAIDDRRDSMNIFNDKGSDKFVFLLSTRAGGLGINLTGADTVIIYDSDWNPQCDLQAQDRCHRIGQTKPVVVYRFVTANTIDQKIIERAAGKRKLEKMVIHKGKFKSGNFMLRDKPKPITPEELRDLLQTKDHESEVKNEKTVISKAELNALLDRSDLYEKWKQGMQQGSQTSPVKKAGTKTKPMKKVAAGDESKTTNTDLFKVMETDDSNSCVDTESLGVSSDGDEQH